MTLSSNGPNSEALLGLHTPVFNKKPVSVTTGKIFVRGLSEKVEGLCHLAVLNYGEFTQRPN